MCTIAGSKRLCNGVKLSLGDIIVTGGSLLMAPASRPASVALAYERSSTGPTDHCIRNSFSDVRKARAINFPNSMKYKQLKSFLGLANYLRVNVPDFTFMMAPLQKLLERPYTKSKTLK
jgi:hypothetical protein